jgi:hypothetical protein
VSRMVFLIGGALVVVLAVPGCSSGHGTSGETAAPSSTAASPLSSTSPGAPTAQDGARFASALVNAQSPELPSVLAVGVKANVAVLPPGSSLSVDTAHAVVDGPRARVPATVTGPLAGRWVLLLVREDGTWRVYGTVRP